MYYRSWNRRTKQPATSYPNMLCCTLRFGGERRASSMREVTLSVTSEREANSSLLLAQLLCHAPGTHTKQVAEDAQISLYDLQSVHTVGKIRFPLFGKLGYGNCTRWIIKTQRRGSLYWHGIYQGNRSCNCSALIWSCRHNAKHMKHWQLLTLKHRRMCFWQCYLVLR